MRSDEERGHKRARRPNAGSARRRTAVAIFVGALMLLHCGGNTTPDYDGPQNVLLITVDTLRADALGAYGQRLQPSPNLDRLAAQGVRFEDCVASAPSTLPSHATIFTGKFPFAHGARANSGYVLSDANTTLAEVLQSRGYVTAAEIATPVIGRHSQLNQGFDQYREVDAFDVERKTFVERGEEKEVAEREAADVARHAARFLEAHSDEKFFLWLHFFDPHSFYLADEPFQSRYAISPYHAEVAVADYYIGEVLQALERLGLDDRTLVVLTSDHGEGLMEHGEETHSYQVYEATMAVPLILRGPGLPRDEVIGSLVRTVDVAPTILDLLGLDPLTGVHGTSLAPLIRGGAGEDWNPIAYGESIEIMSFLGGVPLRFVREGNWKYIHKVGAELYDLDTDPHELDNVIERHPEIAARLRSRLEPLIAGTSAPDDAQIAIDAAALERLHALGYVAAGAPRALDDEIASLELSGLDPALLMKDVRIYNQAWGRKKVGRFAESLILFERLGETHPKSAMILYGRILSLRGLDRVPETIPLLKRAIELDPNLVLLYTDLADAVSAAGDFAEAERALSAALEIDRCSTGARVKLSNRLHAKRRFEEQIALLKEGFVLCPLSTDLANDYAYALATLPVDELRDGTLALEIAQRVVTATGRGRPDLLDTLASALAETGDFEGAAREAQHAVELLEAGGAPEEIITIFRGHLGTFRAGEAIRE